MFEKPSSLIALIAWTSLFFESWLLLLRFIPSDVLSWGFFAFFLVVAFFSSAIAAAPPKTGRVP